MRGGRIGDEVHIGCSIPLALLPLALQPKTAKKPLCPYILPFPLGIIESIRRLHTVSLLGWGGSFPCIQLVRIGSYPSDTSSAVYSSSHVQCTPAVVISIASYNYSVRKTQQMLWLLLFMHKQCIKRVSPRLYN